MNTEDLYKRSAELAAEIDPMIDADSVSEKAMATHRAEILRAVVVQANTEVRAELFAEAVEREKERIRAVRWWHKYVPFKIVKR